MTTAIGPTNEAERLSGLSVYVEKYDRDMVDLTIALAALDTERRLTADRFRDWFGRYRRSEATVWAENSPDSLEALLDALVEQREPPGEPR